ncbi:MAG TPA: hypothetical protein DCS33_10225 [Gammaproteobacteria bacterium]|nr:hypothetical protein [Gammaproteobacteria bacterium]
MKIRDSSPGFKGFQRFLVVAVQKVCFETEISCYTDSIKLKKCDQNKGYSLIELLVSLAILSIL